MKTAKYGIGLLFLWLNWFFLGREYYKSEPQDWVSAITTPVIGMGLLLLAYKLEQFFEPADETRQIARLDGYLLLMAQLLLMVTGTLITEVTYLGSYPALYTAITLAMICITWVWVGREIIQRVRSNRPQSTSDNAGNPDDIERCDHDLHV